MSSEKYLSFCLDLSYFFLMQPALGDSILRLQCKRFTKSFVIHTE